MPKWHDGAGDDDAARYLERRGHHKRFHNISVRQLAKAFRIAGRAPTATTKEAARHIHPRSKMAASLTGTAQGLKKEAQARS